MIIAGALKRRSQTDTIPTRFHTRPRRQPLHADQSDRQVAVVGHHDIVHEVVDDLVAVFRRHHSKCEWRHMTMGRAFDHDSIKALCAFPAGGERNDKACP
jgi:hypothetical protein